MALVRTRILVVGVSAYPKALYRHLRRDYGFTREAANTWVAGYVFGSADGKVALGPPSSKVSDLKDL